MVIEEQRISYLIYPENDLKGHWDTFVTLLLIFTCVVTPYRIALVEVDDLGWIIANYTIDFLFFVDIILNFNSAYYDEDFEIVEDRWTIAKNYLTGWFVVDTLAIFPFDAIAEASTKATDDLKTGQMSEMVRLTRLGRIYKIIKLLRLVRIIKLQKSKKSLVQNV